MTQQSTEPVLTGVVNFRDVGGLPTEDGRRVRHGVLFRSGHLAHATAADQAFLGALGLHTVFDFRNAADQELDGHDVPLPGVRLVNIPLNDPAEGAAFWALVRDGSLAELRAELTGRQAPGLMIASYRQMVLGRTAEHGRVLRALAAGGVPALLHCAAGKDRAGLTVALVLLAVGVERSAIVADYLKSNAPHRRYRLRRPGDGAPPAELAEVEGLLAPLFDARAEYLEAAFEQIDARWGGVDQYLAAGLGLTDADRESLTELLLTAA
ncbi:tyrosine-protein phosphatase [Streptomyces millisiae]|uniref:Tyrosine-protein phosphatase n=1 Tax=Streptomyces millisiae TaxID=3075542 RepID=A0ABU2LIN8_9ACTN|nr:tyrosine-protein phosphatase [Streptomyces sp. DSM 44918]MDT0317453.1 tyrosine-protein phosphatase [Streptomyces sp. DSM 44918]